LFCCFAHVSAFSAYLFEQDGYDRIADLLIRRGDFSGAYSRYLERKQYGGSQRHSLDATIAAVKASIMNDSMSHVKSQADRAFQFQSELRNDALTRSVLHAAVGLFELKRGQYLQAAENFLACDVCVDGNFPEAVTGSDIAIYGALTALAAYDRSTLQTFVIQNQEFKKFLELVPGLYKIVADFQHCRYAQCFEALEKLKPSLMLDIYLAPHVSRIFTIVRDKGVVQYFRPFSSISIPKMADAFAVDVCTLQLPSSPLVLSLQLGLLCVILCVLLCVVMSNVRYMLCCQSMLLTFPVFVFGLCLFMCRYIFGSQSHALEDDIIALIASNRIQGKIDQHNRVLYSENTDSRIETYQKTLTAARSYIRDLKANLLRMSLVEQNISVQYAGGKPPTSNADAMSDAQLAVALAASMQES
jgi:26S proteasome subunit RPN7/PCI domain